MKQGIILIILVSAGLICRIAPEGSAVPGQRPIFPAIRDTSLGVAKKGEGGYLLAQGEDKDPAAASADNPAARRAPGKPQSESTPAEAGQTPKTDPKQAAPPAPIKPFNPSEKIEADQAVDFPYDI